MAGTAKSKGDSLVVTYTLTAEAKKALVEKATELQKSAGYVAASYVYVAFGMVQPEPAKRGRKADPDAKKSKREIRSELASAQKALAEMQARWAAIADAQSKGDQKTVKRLLAQLKSS
ncbi:MAG TPA: hypothetical protein VFO38_06140 [Candidatus Saccharimonadales bacterium]|nr:hypothetical protein [Candidatus Saccharimonadales bacterium]